MRAKILVMLLAALALGACSKSEEPAPQAEAPAQKVEASASHEAQPAAPEGHGSMGAPAQRQIVVPDDVKATWKAVVLEITDKQENKTEEITVNVGETATVGSLEITVESFLPSFTMGGGTITSKSNETENPAARLVVKENGQEIFSGWLFSMYPEAHPFEHERYGVLLKDFVKAEQ